jgi:hypothetical protein
MSPDKTTMVTQSSGANAAVVIYQRNGSFSWVQIQAISYTGFTNSLSSTAISANGSVIVLGDSNYNNQFGSVYIYQKQSSGTWVQKFTYFATSNDNFGASVSISNAGDVVVVGAWSQSVGSVGPGTYNNMGAAVIFKLNNGVWSKKSVLSPANAIPNYYISGYQEFFGWSVR